MYPGTTDDTVMGCDGAGIVIASAEGPNDTFINKRVFLTPTRGWKKDPYGPEVRLGIVGGLSYPRIGTITEYVVVERDEIIEIPSYLSFEEAAAWPCAGITAWRAVFVKGGVKAGQNVLITGVGGGVALTALQLCVAAGANVYVSSGDPAKIDKAVALGAKGGVNYKKEGWPEDLAALIKSTTVEGQNQLLDVVIDQGGGDICVKVNSVLKQGGIVSVFGMHASRSITFTMREVLKNIELKGSTLGSQAELEEATAFIAKHSIVPIISETLEGIDNAPKGFDLLQQGNQMGKIVVKIAPEEGAKL